MLPSVEVLIALSVTEGLLHVSEAIPVLVKEKDVAAVVPTVNVELAEQPEPSVTVTVVVPPVKPEPIEPLLVGVTVEGVGDHDTVNPLAVVPPPTTTVVEPAVFRQDGCAVVKLNVTGGLAVKVTVVVD